MKATLDISDLMMHELEQKAAREGRTVSELMEAAIRSLLCPPTTAARKDLPPLPELHSGGALVDVADRNALYEVLDRPTCL